MQGVCAQGSDLRLGIIYRLLQHFNVCQVVNAPLIKGDGDALFGAVRITQPYQVSLGTGVAHIGVRVAGEGVGLVGLAALRLGRETQIQRTGQAELAGADLYKILVDLVLFVPLLCGIAVQRVVLLGLVVGVRRVIGVVFQRKAQVGLLCGAAGELNGHAAFFLVNVQLLTLHGGIVIAYDGVGQALVCKGGRGGGHTGGYAVQHHPLQQGLLLLQRGQFFVLRPGDHMGGGVAQRQGVLVLIHLAADLGKAVGQGGLALLGVVFYVVYRVQGGRAVKAADHIGGVGRLLCLRNKLGQVLVLQAPIERGAVHTGGASL